MQEKMDFFLAPKYPQPRQIGSPLGLGPPNGHSRGGGTNWGGRAPHFWTKMANSGGGSKILSWARPRDEPIPHTSMLKAEAMMKIVLIR